MSDTPEKVILIHGFASSAFVLQPLRFRLRGFGYQPECWSYPSLFGSIETHAARFREYLESLDKEGQPYHIVAHSMGSIITRVALSEGPLTGLQRIVLLAPPNAGSPMTRLAPPFVKKYCLPVAELADIPTSFVNNLNFETSVDVGVIAARFDMLIPLASTHLEGQCAHTVLPASHSSLLLSGRMATHVREFLRHGRFEGVEA